jgi:hypothetical protein
MDTKYREFIRPYDYVFVLFVLFIENQSSQIHQKIYNNNTIGAIIFWNVIDKCVIPTK